MRICEADKWLETLLDSRSELRVERFALTRIHPHWSVDRDVPENYLTVVVDSANHAEFSGQEYRLEENDLLWLSPGVAHVMRPTDLRKPFRFLHLRFALIADSEHLRLKDDFFLLRNAVAERRDLEILLEEFRLKSVFSAIRFRAMLTILLTGILRKHETCTGKAEEVFSRSQRRTLLDLVSDAERVRVHPSDLANALQLSPDYFSRQFRKHFGISPRTWILRERMNQACTLLTETTMALKEVAAAVGYEDIYLFGKMFRQTVGTSPGRYRRHLS